MDHFAGLDVSVKETSICIVDDAGKKDADIYLKDCAAARSSARACRKRTHHGSRRLWIVLQ
jgi:hypothetical protein